MKTEPEPNAAATRISRFNRCFHRAIRENNAGVDFYNKGSYELSIQALHRALAHLQQFAKHRHRQYPRQETETAKREMSVISGSSSKANCRGRYNYYDYDKANDEMSDPNSSAAMTIPTRTIRVDLNAIYDCALYLSCHGDSWEAFTNPSLSCSESDLVRIQASILFNMGLVHHTQAGAINNEESGNEIRVATALERAILLYGLSLGLQESELGAPISNVYRMALCNNIGQCHASLLHTSESKRWNERLLRLLVWHRHHRTNDENEIDDDDNAHRKNPRTCDCFFANTISLILQDPCLSPAA